MQLLNESLEMVLDPRACETQLIGQLHEDLTEEGAVLVTRRSYGGSRRQVRMSSDRRKEIVRHLSMDDLDRLLTASTIRLHFSHPQSIEWR